VATWKWLLGERKYSYSQQRTVASSLLHTQEQNYTHARIHTHKDIHNVTAQQVVTGNRTQERKWQLGNTGNFQPPTREGDKKKVVE